MTVGCFRKEPLNYRFYNIKVIFTLNNWSVSKYSLDFFCSSRVDAVETEPTTMPVSHERPRAGGFSGGCEFRRDRSPRKLAPRRESKQISPSSRKTACALAQSSPRSESKNRTNRFAQYTTVFV